MLSYLFIIVGLIIFFKKEVKISSKRKLEGKVAQNIGLTYLIPGLIAVLSKILETASPDIASILGLISLAGFAVAIGTTIYFVSTVKENPGTNNQTTTNPITSNLNPEDTRGRRGLFK